MVCDIDGIDTLNCQAFYCFGLCAGSASAIVCHNRRHVHFFPHRVIMHPNKCSKRPVPPAAAPTVRNSPWTRCPWWSFSSCSWFAAIVIGRIASVDRRRLCFTVERDVEVIGELIWSPRHLTVLAKGVRWISRSSNKCIRTINGKLRLSFEYTYHPQQRHTDTRY